VIGRPFFLHQKILYIGIKMKYTTVVLFRPGTLGDQIVLHGSLSSFDLRFVDLVLIERIQVCSANRDFFNKYKFVYSYNSFLSLVLLCFKLSFRYGRPFLLNLTHSKKSYFRVIFDWIFFNIFFSYSFLAMRRFLNFRWRRYRCVSEYVRVFSILNSLFIFNGSVLARRSKFSGTIGLEPPLNVGFVPFSAWPSKDWPLEYSISLIKDLIDDGHNVSIIGNSKLADAFENNNSLSSLGVSRLVNLKLNVLAEFLSEMDLVISMDTSIVHMAVLYSLPTVVVMSDVNRQEDWLPSYENVVVLRKYVPCGGCFSSVCIYNEHPCMTKIMPNDVYLAANDLLLKMYISNHEVVKPA
jgi:hypothetical protein